MMILLLLIFWTSVSVASKCIPESLKKCSCTGYVTGGYTVNCANADLDYVPQGIPKYTTILILDKNNITAIRNDSFGTGLPHLLTLSIKGNGLTSIEADAFNNMPMLETLDLFHNNLEHNNSLPYSVFVPLSKTLKVLDIRRNLMKDNITLIDYPKAIGSLTSLTTLKIDGLTNKALPAYYGQLQNLERLIFGGGRSDVVVLANDTFDTVSKLNITEINLSNLRLGFVNESTLGKVKSLQILDLSNNPSLGSSLIHLVQGLKPTGVHTLFLNNTYMADNVNKIIEQMGRLNIKVLVMDNNAIYEIDPILTKYIPKVEILSFAENYIYEQSKLIWDIYHLKYLIGLNISWQQKSSLYSKEQNFGKNNAKPFHFCQTDVACPCYIPRGMLWLDMSHFGLHLPDMPELVIMNNSTLKNVYVSYSGVQYLKRPIYCTTGKFHTTVQIETFDFRFNTIQCMNKSMFSHCSWKSLKYLYLGSNRLGDVHGNICNDDKTDILGFLKPLTSLIVLDLSMNNIGSNLKNDDFKGLNDLEKIDLSYNNFKNWSLNIQDMRKLDLINISHNNIPCLSTSVVRTLDRLQRQRNKTESISIDMTGNTLSGKCECINFFKWLKMTKVNVVNFHTYHCTFPDGRTWQLNRLDTIVAKLEAECYTILWLDLGIVITLLVYILIFVLTMMYRMRHEIRYMWIKMKMNRERLERLFSSKLSYHKFDAFVSCEHRDARLFVHRHLLPKLETKNRGLTARWLKQRNQAENGHEKTEETKDSRPDMSFCVAQRDFVVGEAIITNVVKSIKASRKVILIVSKYFVSSNWCEEEMRIAHQESLDRGKNIIICIFMPGVEKDKLPGTIRMMTKFVTCLKWPREEKAQKVFWLLLQKAIMDGVQDKETHKEDTNNTRKEEERRYKKRPCEV